MKFNRIIFFGASVTAQKSAVEGEVTGYSPNVENMLRAEYGDKVDIHRLGMVGSHFDSAANMCMSDFQHLLGEKLFWFLNGIQQPCPVLKAGRCGPILIGLPNQVRQFLIWFCRC